ncbi:TetR/AcrR family transcriptional regulator [Agromyces sp. ISL-38]|uniref:TetR/AcrR family transcriptional regulator n=1 Tax=Agromyces sp. ISL-38 TaxID=2819107 RepID=UPI001BECAED8|nr:TetR/AcrR family transcriptional regulator [Agromyces sp. ISL-38]MBT2500491.1 TetR/AcrR family transcriptional regulator [Agromyces sp. ISL-38]MBT2519233.1 TetR/AcrR family transcriptional regulator [Streptomyces sp. ISL-90]
MPTPERTSLDAIVSAGRALLESDGLDGLTMQAVAARVGVRAPSLYKRVRNRDGLIGLIADTTLRELGTRLEAVVNDPAVDPRAGLRQLAREARAFAHEQPAGFRLIFAPGAEVRLDVASLAASSAPVLRVAAALAGERDALHAARTFTAWVNGFVSMELAGAFRLGGDVEHAFEYGVERLADAVALVNPVSGH